METYDNSNRDNESDDSELDDSWINEHNEEEGPYDRFYKEPLESTKIFFLYINKNILETIKSERINLTESYLNKNILIKLIKNNSSINDTRYKLSTILKYNIDAEPDDVLEIFEDISPEAYLSEERYFNDIYFKETICTFQDLNSVFIIYENMGNTNANIDSKKRKSRKKPFKSLSGKTRSKRA